MSDHKQRAHALLSASGASRWTKCTPSARLEEAYEEQTSSFAEEGTMAHELAEIYLRELHTDSVFGEAFDLLNETVSKAREKGYDTDEMRVSVEKYVDYIDERVKALRTETGKEPTVLIEQRLDLSEWVAESFGTSDCSIVSDGLLEVIDLKYGKGVRVDATDNAQLMLYGLGAVRATELLYDEVKTLRLTIVQPRLDHISSFDISREDLERWAQEVVFPAQEKAFKGEGELVAGEHCKFCKHKARCKALEQLTIESAFSDFEEEKPKELTTLSDDEVLKIYKNVSLVKSFLEAVEGHILKTALAGKYWEGLKVVEGRSVRQISDKEALKALLASKEFDSDKYLKPADLFGLGDLEKKLGKDNFRTYVEPYLKKPQCAPTLAPLSDKRPPYSSVDTDFDEVKTSDLLD